MQVFEGTCSCKLYADDLKLYSVIDTLEDLSLLQGAINNLLEWSHKWQMNISHKKCAILHIGPMATDCTFTIDNCAVENVKSFRDLGVLVDSELSFVTHICNIVAKGHARACLIHKCFLSKDTSTLVRAFTTYVRPLLEYCSSVWSPYLKRDINKIESVQRKFTKRLKGLSNISYTERLAVLQLESLELRRLRFDLILTYKILFDYLNTNKSSFFVLKTNSATRGHEYKIQPSHCRVNVRKYFFAHRVIDPWNSLPAKPENFKSLNSFKAFLRRVDLTEFLVCT